MWLRGGLRGSELYGGRLRLNINWKVFTNNIQITEMVQQIPSLKVFNGLEEQLAKVI